MKNFWIITLVIFLTLPSGAAAESWLDAWSRQAIDAPPSGYSGNGRGYLSGGRLSMRFNQAGEIPPPLVSFSPPAADAGCGGIDIFGGALGFVSDGQYLVERYVNIAQGAVAAYAFSLAFDTLCSKCESVTRALSSAATELNKLQFSDCQAAEGIKTVADDLLFDKSKQIETEKRVEAIRSAVENGDDAFRYGVERDENSYTDEISALYAACPVDYRAIFHTNGSLIQNILRLLGEDPQWAEVMAGFFGDVRIHEQDQYEFMPPCLENQNVSDLADHQFHIRNRQWQCVPTTITFPHQTNTYENIYAYIYSNAQMIAEFFYRNDPNETLTPENDAFRHATAPPIFDILAYEFSQAQATTAFDPAAFAEDYSHYYAYDYLNDLIRKMRTTIKEIEMAAKTVWQRTQSRNGTECEKALTFSIIKHLDEIGAEADKHYMQVNAIYRDKQEEKMARFGMAEQFRADRNHLKNSAITKIDVKEQ